MDNPKVQTIIIGLDPYLSMSFPQDLLEITAAINDAAEYMDTWVKLIFKLISMCAAKKAEATPVPKFHTKNITINFLNTGFLNGSRKYSIFGRMTLGIDFISGNFFMAMAAAIPEMPAIPIRIENPKSISPFLLKKSRIAPPAKKVIMVDRDTAVLRNPR